MVLHRRAVVCAYCAYARLRKLKSVCVRNTPCCMPCAGFNIAGRTCIAVPLSCSPSLPCTGAVPARWACSARPQLMHTHTHACMHVYCGCTHAGAGPAAGRVPRGVQVHHPGRPADRGQLPHGRRARQVRGLGDGADRKLPEGPQVWFPGLKVGPSGEGGALAGGPALLAAWRGLPWSYRISRT